VYRAEWTPAAIERLKALHNDADTEDQPAILDAARRITKTLMKDADNLGESRVPPSRILIDRPLVVVYWIGQEDFIDIAYVTQVRLAKKPKR